MVLVGIANLATESSRMPTVLAPSLLIILVTALIVSVLIGVVALARYGRGGEFLVAFGKFRWQLRLPHAHSAQPVAPAEPTAAADQPASG